MIANAKRWFSILRTDNGWIVVGAGCLGNDTSLSEAATANKIASFHSVDNATKYVRALMEEMPHPANAIAPQATAPKVEPKKEAK